MTLGSGRQGKVVEQDRLYLIAMSRGNRVQPDPAVAFEPADTDERDRRATLRSRKLGLQRRSDSLRVRIAGKKYYDTDKVL